MKKYILHFPISILRKKILILMSLTFIFAFSKTTVPVSPQRDFQIKIHNVNQVEMCVSNYAKFAQTEIGYTGCWWPRGSGHNYIWGGGIWFGTVDSTSGDTLVTVGYNPYDGTSEFVPGLEGSTFDDPYNMIYMYPDDWPPSDSVFPMSPQEIVSHQDSWCCFNDLAVGYHEIGGRPIEIEVYQTVYAWDLADVDDIIYLTYEVKNVSNHNLTDCYSGIFIDPDVGDFWDDLCSAVLGQYYHIQGDWYFIDDLAYQWDYDNEVEDWLFADVGVVGFDLLQTPFDLVEDEDKDGDGILDQFERDSSYYWDNLPSSMWDVDNDGLPDWRDASENPQLEMTAFKRFTWSSPSIDRERYLTLAGYNFLTGEYDPYDPEIPYRGDQRFVMSSGPFDLAPDSSITIVFGILFNYWADMYGFPDSALVILDNTCQFIYDMNWLLPGPPPPPNLICIPGDKKVTLVWDNKSEIAPDPYFGLIGDPSSPIYDPYYREYDFEGYGVWKSITAEIGEWELLSRCDLFNGIIFEDMSQPDSIRIKAEDTGIFHTFVDEEVRNGFTYYYAITAFDYNWVKSEYDSIYMDTFLVILDTMWVDSLGDTIYVWDTIPDYDTLQVIGAKPLFFESSKFPVTASPRTDPANYVAPGEPEYEVEYGHDSLYKYLDIIYTDPLNVAANKPIYIQFGPVWYDSIVWKFRRVAEGIFEPIYDIIPKYKIMLLDDNEQVVDSSFLSLTLRDSLAGKPLQSIPASLTHGFSAINGVNPVVNITRNTFPHDEDFTIYDGGEVISGNYPEEYLTPKKLGYQKNIGTWAYRGNSYEVTWQSPIGPVTVVDMENGDTIPFKHFYNIPDDPWARDSAECWCFFGRSPQNPSSVAETLVTTGSVVNRTWFIWICGGIVNLSKGGPISDTILPETGDVWQIKPALEFYPAPINARIKVTLSPGYFSTENQDLNVKVCPNPYIIGNEWQQSPRNRKLKFINLPNECTIRIFNLNGELIKVIVHKETTIPEDGQIIPNDAGGDEWWDLLTMGRQPVTSGVYVFHIRSDIGEQVGKFVVIR